MFTYMCTKVLEAKMVRLIVPKGNCYPFQVIDLLLSQQGGGLRFSIELGQEIW
jgi:hypothetical protein